MPNINIENISDLDLNGNDLFEDSESFITEITDDNEQSIVGGYYFRYFRIRNYGEYYKNNRFFLQINNCGNTVTCANTLGGYLRE